MKEQIGSEPEVQIDSHFKDLERQVRISNLRSARLLETHEEAYPMLRIDKSKDRLNHQLPFFS